MVNNNKVDFKMVCSIILGIITALFGFIVWLIVTITSEMKL